MYIYIMYVCVTISDRFQSTFQENMRRYTVFGQYF